MRPLFTQERAATSAGAFLDGLLGQERRKTGWMRAEAAGDPGPWRQQAVLGRGRWDADALRDVVRDYALETEPEPPTDEGVAASDRAERSAILAFRARMAAARICLPKGALGAALRALHRERRAYLQALQDRIAARHAMQAHKRRAHEFRRTAALTARGLLQRPVPEAPDETNARVRATILNRLDA